MTSLLLASASPARLATLRSAGIEPRVQVSGVDEDAVLAAATARLGRLDPAEAVLVLAQAKAEAVARALAEAAPDDDSDDDEDGGEGPGVGSGQDGGLLVLGCDSLLELDGQALGKPRDAADAVARWQQMRGRRGVLHTGHWIVDTREPAPGARPGGAVGATSSTVVHFADLSDAEVEAYVATGEPLEVAGAFTVDGLGGPFVQAIEGDHHGVVGVSLPVLRGLLGQLGVAVHELWVRRG